jgi:hypothetical protein
LLLFDFLGAGASGAERFLYATLAVLERVVPNLPSLVVADGSSIAVAEVPKTCPVTERSSSFDKSVLKWTGISVDLGSTCSLLA